MASRRSWGRWHIITTIDELALHLPTIPWLNSNMALHVMRGSNRTFGNRSSEMDSEKSERDRRRKEAEECMHEENMIASHFWFRYHVRSLYSVQYSGPRTTNIEWRGRSFRPRDGVLHLSSCGPCVSTYNPSHGVTGVECACKRLAATSYMATSPVWATRPVGSWQG